MPEPISGLFRFSTVSVSPRHHSASHALQVIRKASPSRSRSVFATQAHGAPSTTSIRRLMHRPFVAFVPPARDDPSSCFPHGSPTPRGAGVSPCCYTDTDRPFREEPDDEEPDDEEPDGEPLACFVTPDRWRRFRSAAVIGAPNSDGRPPP